MLSVISGLGFDWNDFIMSFDLCVESIRLDELHSQLVNHERMKVRQIREEQYLLHANVARFNSSIVRFSGFDKVSSKLQPWSLKSFLFGEWKSSEDKPIYKRNKSGKQFVEKHDKPQCQICN